jgi:hypothetical protein
MPNMTITATPFSVIHCSNAIPFNRLFSFRLKVAAPRSPTYPSSIPDDSLPPAAAATDFSNGKFTVVATTSSSSSSPSGGTVVEVKHGVIVSSKTADVEHVILPAEKKGCCGGCMII